MAAPSLRELKERIQILKEIEITQGKLTQEQQEELKVLERQVAAHEKKVKLTKEQTEETEKLNKEKEHGADLDDDSNISAQELLRKYESLDKSLGKRIRKLEITNKLGSKQLHTLVSNERELLQSTKDKIKEDGPLNDIYKDRVNYIEQLNDGAIDAQGVRNLEADVTRKIAEQEEIINDTTGKYSDKEKEIAKSKKEELAIDKQILKNRVQVMDNIDAVNELQSQGKELLGEGNETLGLMNKGWLAMRGKIGGAAVAIAMATFALKKFSTLVDKIGKDFGALVTTDEALRRSLMQSNVELLKIGKSMSDASEVATTLTDNFGVGLNEALATTTAINRMGTALALSNSEAANIIGTFTEISGLSTSTAIDLSKQVFALSKANNVAPQGVLRDIAQSAEAIAKFSGETPDNLIRSAIQAKKLGTNLNTVTSALRKSLDLESSLRAEMEASVLIGRRINLQEVRRKTLAGDIEGAMSAMVKQLGSQAEFEKLNVLQKEALADATGFTVDQMAKFVNKSKEAAKITGALGDQRIDNLVPENTLSALTKLKNMFVSIGAEFAAGIGPAIATLAKTFLSVFQTINSIIPVAEVLVGVMGFLAGRAFAAAVAMLMFKTVKGLKGWVALAGAGAALVMIAKMRSEMSKPVKVGSPSFDDLKPGEAATVVSGEAKFHAGETVVREETLGQIVNAGLRNNNVMAAEQNLNRLIDEVKGLRKDTNNVNMSVSNLKVSTDITNRDLRVTMTGPST